MLPDDMDLSIYAPCETAVAPSVVSRRLILLVSQSSSFGPLLVPPFQPVLVGLASILVWQHSVVHLDLVFLFV